MPKRAVYTIRDHEGWVRYVGSSGLPEGRYASHLNEQTPIGDFMRNERSLGRDVFLRVEEWLETKVEGYRIERLYIAGYAKLSGSKLLNRARPDGRVRVHVDVDPAHVCLREGCNRKLYERGLCSPHYWEILKTSWKLPKKYQDDYMQRCVDAGLILKEEPVVEISAESIYGEMKNEIRAKRQVRQAIRDKHNASINK